MFKKILGSLISPIKDLLSEVVVDRDKKKEINARIDELTMNFAQEYEQELSKRHELDMKSDSWLSKNIRPMTLAFLLLMFVVISFFDGNLGGFIVTPAYIPVYQMLLSLVFTFYFGSRGAEKIAKIINDNKTKNDE